MVPVVKRTMFNTALQSQVGTSFLLNCLRHAVPFAEGTGAQHSAAVAKKCTRASTVGDVFSPWLCGLCCFCCCLRPLLPARLAWRRGVSHSTHPCLPFQLQLQDTTGALKEAIETASALLEQVGDSECDQHIAPGCTSGSQRSRSQCLPCLGAPLASAPLVNGCRAA